MDPLNPLFTWHTTWDDSVHRNSNSRPGLPSRNGCNDLNPEAHHGPSSAHPMTPPTVEKPRRCRRCVSTTECVSLLGKWHRGLIRLHVSQRSGGRFGCPACGGTCPTLVYCEHPFHAESADRNRYRDHDVFRERLNQACRWVAAMIQGRDDVKRFRIDTYKHARIRDLATATPPQLKRASLFAVGQIQKYCVAHGTALPWWARSGSDDDQ